MTDVYHRFSNINSCVYSNYRSTATRTWVIVIFIAAVAIIGLGLGLGFGLRKGDDDEKGGTSSTNPQKSPLYNEPSTSKQGRYRFAAVAADNEQCSQIGK